MTTVEILKEMAFTATETQRRALEDAISALSTEGDLISRQAILDRTVNRNSIWNKITDSEGNNLEDILNFIPCADVRENIRGET